MASAMTDGGGSESLTAGSSTLDTSQSRWVIQDNNLLSFWIYQAVCPYNFIFFRKRLK